MPVHVRVPGYAEQNSIRKLYEFDLSYHSNVVERKQQYRNEENYWTNHKQLSRAEKFAAGAVAQNLTREKQALFAVLADRVKKAENAEAAAKKDVQARYEAHLRLADEQAEKLYNEGLARREKYYQELLKIAKTSSDVTELMDIAKKFDQLGDYQDSRNLAEHCRNRAAELQAEQDAEADRKAEIARKEAESAAKQNKMIAIVTLSAIAVFVALLLVWSNVIAPNIKFNDAMALMEAGQYKEATEILIQIKDFKDSSAKVAECQEAIYAANYSAAEALMEAGEYEKAKEAFRILSLSNYKDSEARMKECVHILKYQNAEKMAEEGKTLEAAIAFGKLAGFKDATQRSYALWETQENQTLAVGRAHMVALKNDGTVIASGANDDGRCNVSDWKDIVQVAAANGQTFGLRIDGTVLAIGNNEDNQCDVSDWKNVVKVYAGDFHTVGLKVDGTVVATGWNELNQCNVSNWENISDISVSDFHTVGLKEDGTVVAAGNNADGECDVSGWTDIVQICATKHYTVGLCKDGTVVATGNNSLGQCDVEEWSDIVAIGASSGTTLGLRTDGTVLAIGNNGDNQCDVSGWMDIAHLIAANGRAIGLRTDGTVVSVGMNDGHQCETSDWKDILVVYGGIFATAGLRSDGTIVVAGDFLTEKCECEVYRFTDIKIP